MKRDDKELEKRINEAVSAEHDERLANGESYTEADKEFVRKSTKFKLTSLSFYGPGELDAWKLREEEKLRSSQLAA